MWHAVSCITRLMLLPPLPMTCECSVWATSILSVTLDDVYTHQHIFHQPSHLAYCYCYSNIPSSLSILVPFTNKQYAQTGISFNSQWQMTCQSRLLHHPSYYTRHSNTQMPLHCHSSHLVRFMANIFMMLHSIPDLLAEKWLLASTSATKSTCDQSVNQPINQSIHQNSLLWDLQQARPNWQ